MLEQVRNNTLPLEHKLFSKSFYVAMLALLMYLKRYRRFDILELPEVLKFTFHKYIKCSSLVSYYKLARYA